MDNIILNQNAEARSLLVDLLHEAAQLEHSLLDSYLYTACNLKTLPQEFESEDGRPNRRRAIQFERVRAWKQSMLFVAHEEMVHLHYVQCLLRGLGEKPSFTLPKKENGNWIIPNWRERVDGTEPSQTGVEIPLAPLSLDQIRRFVLFEAADSLQDTDPFGSRATELFNQLYAFELDLRLEIMLFVVDDDAERNALKAKLKDIYFNLPPAETPSEFKAFVTELLRTELPNVEDLRFQSIADFYLQGILPLYDQAFEFGWVTQTNRDFNNELQDPNYAAEGFLPIGPIYRDKNFEKASQANLKNPLRNYNPSCHLGR